MNNYDPTDLSHAVSIASEVSLRFNQEEASDLYDLILLKLDDGEFALDTEFLEFVTAFNRMLQFNLESDPGYHQLIVKQASLSLINPLSRKLKAQTDSEAVKNTLYNWIFNYGLKKALCSFMDDYKLPFNSQLAALSKNCVANILKDFLFERLLLEKNDWDLERIRRFEQKISASEDLAFQKLAKTRRFMQKFTGQSGLPSEEQTELTSYVKKIEAILLLHFLIFELFPQGESPAAKEPKTVDLFELGAAYYKQNLKFFRVVNSKGAEAAREIYPQIFSLLDFMPRILRMILLSYHYCHSAEEVAEHKTEYAECFAKYDSLWNMERAASFLYHRTNNVDCYKKRCFFMCKLITNYVEVNNFKYRIGALTLKDELLS